MRDLLWRHAAVRIDHQDDVTGGGAEAGAQCVALPDPLLHHHDEVGAG
jgi:hypothetical protein